MQFRTPPLQLFNHPADLNDEQFREQLRDGTLCQIRPNILTLSIQPREAITLSFGVKTPGPEMIMADAHLCFDYRDRFGTTTAPAYERLLVDALDGDMTLFLRGDEIEASWRFADAFTRAWSAPDAPPLLEYAAGTWGPPEADAMFHGCEGVWTHGDLASQARSAAPAESPRRRDEPGVEPSAEKRQKGGATWVVQQR